MCPSSISKQSTLVLARSRAKEKVHLLCRDTDTAAAGCIADFQKDRWSGGESWMMDKFVQLRWLAEHEAVLAENLNADIVQGCASEYNLA